MVTQQVERRQTSQGLVIVATAERCADGTWLSRFLVDDMLICGKLLVGSDDQVQDQLNTLSAEIAATLEGPTLWTL